MRTTRQHVAQMTVHPLTLDFLQWVATQPRSYVEAMEAWQTSCPRLSIWEDALAEGLIAVEPSDATAIGTVVLTAAGRVVLDQR